MASLSELIEQLDVIDSQIIELYEKRMEICSQVGAYKITAGKAVLDKEREIEKLNQVMQKASKDYNKAGLVELFELLMAQSRKLQQQMMESQE